MNVRKYRPEIDGLRALSVMGVVLFHLGLSVPGGFVGVDVFFVISGYLITGILLRNLREDRFSLVDFWSRRVRRIAPAAVAMVLGTLAMGAYFLTPVGFESLGRSLVAHVLFASNCYFSQDQGYFAESADSIPLLHTWSLAVEEQFYLIFPLILMLVWKLRPRLVMPAMIALALWSLVWSHFKLEWNAREAFFLLPPRGWELLAGAILAGLPRTNFGPALKEVLSAVGLGLIALPMMFYSKETPFPGEAALPSVLGAVLFILVNEGHQTRLGKLLSVRPVVAIGLISYSLYLWHWPLFVFARMVNQDLDLTWKISLLVASLLMGWASWKWVETPFRVGGVLKTAPRSLAFGGATMAVLLGVAFSIQSTGGFPQRFPVNLRLIMEDVNWSGEEYTEVKDEPVVIGNADAGSVDFVLWGDSHGVAATPGMDAAAKNLGLKGWAFLNNATPPVPGIWTANLSPEDAKAMMDLNDRIFTKIIASGTSHLVLASRWTARCQGYNEAEMEGRPKSFRRVHMVVNRENFVPNIEQSSAVLLEALIDLSARLREHGIKLWLFQQVPESTVADVASRFYSATRFPLLYSLDERATSLAEHRERENKVMTALATLPAGTVEIIDATQAFFPEGEAADLKIYAERSYYRDDDHLSRFGSVHYLQPVFEKVLAEIKAGRR